MVDGVGAVVLKSLSFCSLYYHFEVIFPNKRAKCHALGRKYPLFFYSSSVRDSEKKFKALDKGNVTVETKDYIKVRQKSFSEGQVGHKTGSLKLLS